MVDFGVLGPLLVSRDGRPIDLGGPKQRAVLALLLLDLGRVVSTDRLALCVWGDEPPANVAGGLQVSVSNLRRMLREDGAGSPIVRRSPGYLLDVDPHRCDLTRFTEAAAAARAAAENGRWKDAVDEATAALDWWRGPLLADFADEEWVRVPAAAVDEQRVACELHLITGLLGADRVNDALVRAGALSATEPLREQVCHLHMLALHRVGRSGDALQLFRDHSTLLDEELGLEPGPELRGLQAGILRQDPALSRWPNAPGLAAIAVGPESQPVAATDPLVGRQRELAEIGRVVEAAITDTRWVVLTGEAGIGKSRLAEEMARQHLRAGGRVSRATCPDDDGAPAWRPLRQVVRDLGGDPDTVFASEEDRDADTARFAAYDRLAAALAHAAGSAGAPAPVLVVIDDVQWADDATARFLLHLAEVGQVAGLVLLLTVRTGSAASGRPLVVRLLAALARRTGNRTLALPPLEPADVATLVTQVSGAPCTPAEARDLARRTEGNPFFVTEYARLPAGERADGAVPVAIRSVLGLRLAALDPAVLQVLRTAATIGDAFDPGLLAAATRLDLDDLADLLDEAAGEHILAVDPTSGRYAFAHALLRDEVLAGLPDLRRRRLHLRVAETIGANASGDRLSARASHLLAALPVSEPAEVLLACRAAALEAEATWQSDAAAFWWGGALTAFDQLSSIRVPDQTGYPGVDGGNSAGSDLLATADVDRFELIIAQVSAWSRAGRSQTVLDVLDSAMLDAIRHGRLDSAGRLAATLLRTAGAWPWVVFGSDPGPLKARLAGLEPLVREEPAAHIRVLAALAVGSVYDSDESIARTLSARALEQAEALGDPDVLADALLARALTCSAIADRAVECIELMSRLPLTNRRFGAIDRVIADGLLYTATMALADPAAADHIRSGTAGSDLLRLPTARLQMRWSLASLTHWYADDFELTRRRYAEAYASHRQTELYESSVHELARFALAWEQGTLAETTDLVVDPGVMPWAAAVLAAATGDPAADTLLRAELARVQPLQWTTLAELTLLAHAVVDRGLRTEATVLRERLLPRAGFIAIIGQVSMVGPVALALARIDILLGDFESARSQVGTARRLADRAHGHGAQLRCRLLDLQLDRLQGSDVDVDAVSAVLAEARRRAMHGVAAEAADLLADVDGACSA